MAQERNLNLDLIKIIAMCFVVAMHTIRPWFVGGFNINTFYTITICGTAIPLFFTVSGYLLLGRKNIEWNYSLRKIWGITKFVFVVCWIFWAGRFLLTGEPQWDKLYKDPLGAFLMGGTFWQFWYFGAMNIIYFVYPLINKIYNEKPKLFNRIFIGIILTCTVIYIINIVTPGTLEKRIPQSLRLWNWAMYFCLGGFIKKYIKKISWKWVILMAIIYGLQLLGAKYINRTMFKADYNYASPITMLYIYCLFQALNSINSNKISTGIKTLSPLFLPVYTIHTGFIYACPSIKVWLAPIAPIYWMLITIISIGISWLIMQTIIGKWIFKI